MSSALKPVLTPTGTQNPPVPAQMNKPMHPQGSSGPYAQQMPQNLMNIPHNNPNPAHNMSQNHFSLNIPNSYSNQGTPQASNHPVASQAHVQPVSYSPPKNQNYNQSYQPQHNSNIPATQSLPATQGQAASEPEKPQSNGTTDVKVNKPEPNHIMTPKKETLHSPEKAKVSPEKPAVGASTSSEVKPVEVKPTIEPAEVPQNVTLSSPAPASTTTTNSPSAPMSAATASKDPSPASTPTTTTTLPACSVSSSPAASSSPQHKSEPSVAATVESSTPASASSPTSSATTSSTTGSTSKTSDVPEPAEPAPPANAASPAAGTSEKPAEAQEAHSSGSESSSTSPPAKVKEQSAPKSPIKVATTPRTPTRKTKTPKSDQDSPKTTKISVATTSSEPKPSSSKSPGGGKAKRARIKTQPYQSPLPELEIISKMTSVSTPRSKNSDEKLIIFYKNEFLAVRNSEGGFYVCQAVQNVYKSSPRIRIRWLSQEKGEKTGEIYTPDFYDNTDFDCILTNLNLERVDKGKYRLPLKEKDRTDNILKRAIAVEKGEATSLDDSLTEDNPDGLDVSLYRDEEQLKKRKGTKRKSSHLNRSSTRAHSKRSPEAAKLRKLSPKSSQSKSPKRGAKKSPASSTTSSSGTPEAKKTSSSLGRAERAKRRSGQDPITTTKSSPVVDQKKAKVLAKVAKRTAVSSPKVTTPPKIVSVKSSKQPAPSTSKIKSTPTTSKASTPPARRTQRKKK